MWPLPQTDANASICNIMRDRGEEMNYSVS